MNWRGGLTVGLGLAFVLGGLRYAIRAAAGEPVTGDSPVLGVLVGLLTVLGVAWALWQLRSAAGDDETTASAAPLVEPSPERTPADVALSGLDLAERLDRAGERAREDGSVESGLAVVRPALRATLEGVLVQGGVTAEAATEMVDRGTWTDDPVAAAVVSADAPSPTRSRRERFRAWLRPERTLRRRVRRAVAELDGVASARLPSVPGQGAPRRVRVVQPRLETLERAADGSLQPAGTPVGPVGASPDDDSGRSPVGDEGVDS